MNKIPERICHAEELPAARPLKVLARNKFYTCVSLFSISVTLMVLVLVTSLVDSFVYPQARAQ